MQNFLFHSPSLSVFLSIFLFLSWFPLIRASTRRFHVDDPSWQYLTHFKGDSNVGGRLSKYVQLPATVLLFSLATALIYSGERIAKLHRVAEPRTDMQRQMEAAVQSQVGESG